MHPQGSTYLGFLGSALWPMNRSMNHYAELPTNGRTRADQAGAEAAVSTGFFLGRRSSVTSVPVPRTLERWGNREVVRAVRINFQLSRLTVL